MISEKLLKVLLCFGFIIFCAPLQAATDLSPLFMRIYDQSRSLSYQEQKTLRDYDIYFIPGILAESFLSGDKRSSIHLEYVTRDYFSYQLSLLNTKYNIPAKRLGVSSKNVSETRSNIRQAIAQSANNNRKVLFISHSLGGIALLEEMIENPGLQKNIAGVVFMQSPFYGSPLSDIVMEPSYGLKFLLSPLFPYVNLSETTVTYVGIEARTRFMQEHSEEINNLINTVPLFTFSSFVDSSFSIFRPLIDIIGSGCIKGPGGNCVTSVFYPGPYDKNDGLIPLHSSFLGNADYVTLEGVDHAEIILDIPFEKYSKEDVTTTLLRLILQKIQPGL
ncbi:MAG: hypothetical protein ACM3MG_05260 [Bacillota bacterium]